MADYDSDSSGIEDVETNVLLGYASADPTGDDFTQLGGHPLWLDDLLKPSGSLVKCKVCNGLMSLLLQINADMPDRFANHERRLYIWACRKKVCRHKDGSVRAIRATRRTGNAKAQTAQRISKDASSDTKAISPQPVTNIGEALFGVKSTPGNQLNPFATASTEGQASSNPFAATSSLAAKPAQRPTERLSETFADKVRISEPSVQLSKEKVPHEPWPETSSFPKPFPSKFVDADKEYIESEPQHPSANINISADAMDTEGGSSTADDKAAFESTMDKTFQRFADRLAQNPEQILRYEYAGQPLLYSATDVVGKLFASAGDDSPSKVKLQKPARAPKIPRCTNCGADRKFEMQLTPHAITELEEDEVPLDGMDWGTIIMAVCAQDCSESDKGINEVGYVEEWIGVQWEELSSRR